MKPEYQFKVEGLVNKEQVVNGLMASGYILSVNKRFGDIYEISVYGKERVDGKGLKETDWFEKMDKPVGGKGIIDSPKITGGTITTTGSPNTWVSNISCDAKFLVDPKEIAAKIHQQLKDSNLKGSAF